MADTWTSPSTNHDITAQTEELGKILKEILEQLKSIELTIISRT